MARVVTAAQAVCTSARSRPTSSAHSISKAMALLNGEEFKNLSPSQIVPRLADQGRYIASESTLYRLLHQAGQMKHRRLEREAVKKGIMPLLNVTGGLGRQHGSDQCCGPTRSTAPRTVPTYLAHHEGCARSEAPLDSV